MRPEPPMSLHTTGLSVDTLTVMACTLGTVVGLGPIYPLHIAPPQSNYPQDLVDGWSFLVQLVLGHCSFLLKTLRRQMQPPPHASGAQGWVTSAYSASVTNALGHDAQRDAFRGCVTLTSLRSTTTILERTDSIHHNRLQGRLYETPFTVKSYETD